MGGVVNGGRRRALAEKLDQGLTLVRRREADGRSEHVCSFVYLSGRREEVRRSSCEVGAWSSVRGAQQLRQK